MSSKTKNVQRLKKSICKVLGLHKEINLKEPYLEEEGEQYGGTAFFVDPKNFGDKFPTSPYKRYLLTNYHVIETLETNKCSLHYPEHGLSYINAKVEFILPTFDVAILSVNPNDDHPMWLVGNIGDFLESVPNLNLFDKIVKGNSQDVIAVGFPNLSSDYQICDGIISGRGLGMIQLNISFNGGNSGGPLFHKNKVIGICTASISESEALGLAVPMTQILNYFQKWTEYGNLILTVPSWGVIANTTTNDYLNFHDIDVAFKGALVNKVVPGSSVAKILKPKDILMGISSDGKRYNIDQYGLLQTGWTDKRVPIDDHEFLTSLDPDDITISFYQHRTKKIVTKPITLVRQHSKVRDIYPNWEENEYMICGGCVFMNLSMNHFHVDDEDESDIPFYKSIPLSNHVANTLKQEEVIVVTHIPFQSHVHNQRILSPYDRIVKFNNKKVKGAAHMQKLLEEAIAEVNLNNRKHFIVLETQDTKVYLNMHMLRKDDEKNKSKESYPVNKLSLLKLKPSKKKTKKRKRGRAQV